MSCSLQPDALTVLDFLPMRPEAAHADSALNKLYGAPEERQDAKCKKQLWQKGGTDEGGEVEGRREYRREAYSQKGLPGLRIAAGFLHGVG